MTDRRDDRPAVGASWADCEHEWELARGDWDCPENCEQVVCVKCSCPGERDERGGVFWPAT